MAPNLGLDLKLSSSKIITNFSKQASSINDDTETIEEYITNLEEERRKISAFKRELPLCMFILNDVIDGMKTELEQSRREKNDAIKCKMEEDRGVKMEKDCIDNKVDWMSSAQLWSDNYSCENNNVNNTKKIERSDESDHRQTPSLESKSKGFGGAFVPFKGISRKEVKVSEGLPDLSLLSSPSKPVGSYQVSSHDSSHLSLQSQQQGPRKARRTWSPELHRRFVGALQQLGGVQVATPKQIRELMEVDGLTNDEVKSHLQKYRLHARKGHDSVEKKAIIATGNSCDSLVQKYTTSQQSAAQSGSPLGSLQLHISSSRAISITASDSNDEDCKSESYSCK